MKFSIQSSESGMTEALAEQIGTRLRGGEVLELVADLGGGKTTFMRGLVRGAKSSDTVSSPTFTISKVYSAPAFEIHHFDFYRLPDPGLIVHELEDLVGDPGTVVAVEWATDVQHVLPENRLTLQLEALGETERRILLECTPMLDYLLEGLC